MTNKKHLKILRVIVKCGGKVVYDQGFHSGLNVIRGDNGTGKSTIMELISYGLGGDIKKGSWKKEALECTEIFIAVELNEKPFVLKRVIADEGSKPPISIFEGDFADSKAPDSEWFVFKSRRSDSRKSYSMQIFELLGLEQHSTADSDSLTIHQLLRILYIDQDTPASKIFRTEPLVYDKESMRRAIGEYAFGFDDLEAHTLRQKVNDKRKQFDKLDEELRSIYRLLGSTNIKSTKNELEYELKELYEELSKIDVARIDIRSEDYSYKDKGLAKQAVEVQKQIEDEVDKLSILEQNYLSESYEVSESLEFLNNLEYRKRQLINAKGTREALLDLEFRFCPSCMSELGSVPEGSCSLCKCELIPKFDHTYIQSLNELDFQISETSQVLESIQLSRSKFELEIKNSKRLLKSLRSKFSRINRFTSDYEKKIVDLSESRGFISGQIKNLEDRMELATDLDARRKFKDSLQADISDLESKLEKLEASRLARIRSVKRRISDQVVYILSRDQSVEPAFDCASKFEFDFSSDGFRLDDRANFSASSNVILKNTFHLSVLLQSVDDENFRIPCFMMFDNIEDKGMREERSQNFQNIMLEMLSGLSGDYQVIMTTSMVASSLNNDTFGVGPFYKKGMHTLDFSR
ncbi:AAA family ATPase [Marinobacter hydrocarbonoclasticus]|uniref:AAA family ATPase n=1 Tax=Marinobacter nauticus TaxID=2743 RepID=UPI001A8C6C35|nr:AAA family ATPase [Marinobacter nauticus]MBN8238939.1 AAA family ATPase [Marinobacter nauticus]